MFKLNTPKTSLLAIAGVFAPLIFVLNIVLWGAMTPGYSHLSQYVSELGAVDAPYGEWMNALGIVPFGGLIMLFSFSFWRGTSGKLVWFLLMPGLFLTGLGFVLAGYYRCDVGCSFQDMSDSAIIHNLAAFGAFILAILTVTFALVINVKATSQKMNSWLLSGLLLAMIVAFSGLIVLGPGFEYVGAVQRGFLLPFCLWLLLYAVKQMEQVG